MRGGKIMRKIYLLLLLGCTLCHVRAGTEVSRKMIFTANCTNILSLIDENQPEGIVATISQGGYVKIKLRVCSLSGTAINEPVYFCQSTLNSTSDEDYVANEILGEKLTFEYNLFGLTYHVKSGKDIRGRLQHIVPERPAGSGTLVSVNYPHTLMDDVYSSWLNFSLIPLPNYQLTTSADYYDNTRQFELELITKDAEVKKVAIPGLGIIRPFNANHPCNFIPSGDLVCNCLQTIKRAGNRHIADILPAAHRGIWGGNAAGGPPENSAEAINGAKNANVKIVEVDIMATKDKQLICLHDYNLERLTNVSGQAYIFDKNYAEIQNLKLRNRGGTVSASAILKFTDLIDIVKNQDLVLMIDIKEMVARMVDGICVANCNYQTPAKQQESWFEILSLCYNTLQTKNAQRNVIFKTYFTPELLFPHMEVAKREKVLFTPMLISKNFNNDIQQLCAYVDNWINKGGNMIAYFETDFFNASDIQLQRFTRNGKSYTNILDYLNQKGYRGGIFSEEPVGSKGVVNRWAEWKMKNSLEDFRADYLRLMDIPYGNNMVITTDRTDIWQQIKNLQK